MAQKKKQDPREIWVYMESDPGYGLSEGEQRLPKRVSFEAMSLGRTLADRLGVKLGCVVIGDEETADLLEREANARGADRIFRIADPRYAVFTLERYAEALSYLMGKYNPLALILSATSQGRDLAPATSIRAGAALIADCQEARAFKMAGRIIWKRASFSGSVLSDVACSSGRMQVTTVRPGLFPKAPVLERQGEAELLQESFPAQVLEGAGAASVLAEILREEVSNQVDLEDAEVIVSGGRGAGGSEGFRLIKELADVLGGQVGASRVAVDKGWIDHAHLIGQSGKTVAPKLYITCGISGSVQHITGMRDAGCVVSINSDPKALIFNVSDYALVGDMFQVLPVLIEEMKKLKRDK